MTEDEAKTKWCPFTRTARDGEDFSANRDRDGGIIDRKHTCIGTACMAFRGRLTDDFSRRAEAAFRRDGARIRPAPTDLDGWCGLAGAIQ